MWGAAGWLYRAVAGTRLTPPARVLAFAAAFGLWEWLRGHMLTGFPWDLVGETWRAGSPLSQAAALVGAYGLTTLTFLVGAAPATLAARGSLRDRVSAPAAALLLVAVGGGWGAWRIGHAARPSPNALLLRAVQPDLPEPASWSPQIVQHALDLYTGLTRAPGAGGRPPDIVVWPEGAIPDSFNSYLAPGSPGLAQVASALRPGQQLLTGGFRAAPGPAGGAIYFNSLLALRRTQAGLELEGVYDKHHLVPFGEYLPLPWLFGTLGLRRLVSVPTDFTPGPPPRALTLADGDRVQPLICYEALFPGLARAGLRNASVALRPQLLVNVSDDAWFGRASGPWQHLNLASYRAIEEGLPMVRATPTGVSAVIDAYGRPAAPVLAPSRAGVVDAPAPPALPPTLYARTGDLGLWLLESAAFGVVLTLRRPRSRDKRPR